MEPGTLEGARGTLVAERAGTGAGPGDSGGDSGEFIDFVVDDHFRFANGPTDRLTGVHSPRVDRPDMPDGYGVPDTASGTLDWESVEDRLRESVHYWMSTTRPDGRPHVVPRWGVWLESRFWYDGSPATVHAKNLRANPACALHLESGAHAVILEGSARPADPPGLELGARLASEFGRKYADRGYSPGDDAWEGADAGGLVVFTPAKALAWFEFPSDVTRFRFH